MVQWLMPLAAKSENLNLIQPGLSIASHLNSTHTHAWAHARAQVYVCTGAPTLTSAYTLCTHSIFTF